MQRVRIGLTGLGVVFLLVLFGAVVRSASDEAPITANSLEQQLVPGTSENNGQQAEPTEPLAELGVAPGNAEANMSASQGTASGR